MGHPTDRGHPASQQQRQPRPAIGPGERADAAPGEQGSCDVPDPAGRDGEEVRAADQHVLRGDLDIGVPRRPMLAEGETPPAAESRRRSDGRQHPRAPFAPPDRSWQHTECALYRRSVHYIDGIGRDCTVDWLNAPRVAPTTPPPGGRKCDKTRPGARGLARHARNCLGAARFRRSSPARMIDQSPLIARWPYRPNR